MSELEPLFNSYLNTKEYKNLYRSHKKYLSKLDKKSKAVLKAFTGGDNYYQNISGLRNRNIPANDKVIPIDKAREIMLKIIRNAPELQSDITIFRGGNNKVDRNFTSYTLKPNVAEFYASNMGFSKGHIKILKIQKGQKVLFLEPITEYPEEYEILLQPTSKVSNRKNQHILTVQNYVS